MMSSQVGWLGIGWRAHDSPNGSARSRLLEHDEPGRVAMCRLEAAWQRHQPHTDVGAGTAETQAPRA